ncbi:queuosine precursor transporter [Xenorhabdus szentirmaii]|uniref:queuosine precursor transporter n=1 Tax=Xenorhabdus szentirmaii TaxID=290112 RepID=UPI0032B74302
MSSNQKYKLLGFSRSSDAIRANLMILSTGKSLSIPLKELESSQVSEDLNRNELREIYRRIYGSEDTVTAYDLTDRNERSWFAYLVIVLSLTIIYIFCTVTGIKPISIPHINMVIPAAIFFYPFTFILVDILNEFYGLRLARKAILFSFTTNILFVLGLMFTAVLPGLREWGLADAYTEIVHSITAVLVASSVAYIVSENVNSWLLCKIKELTNSRYLFIRIITSTTIAAALDSVIFCTLAFYNMLDADTIKTIIFSQFIIKLTYTIVGVGPIYATRALFRKYINS